MKKSPFPGMDPYLEGSLWPDFHHSLATKIRNMITPQITPKYIALIDRYVVKDTEAEEDVGIMYPDVEVLAAQREARFEQHGDGHHVLTPAPVTITIPVMKPVEVRIPVIHIRDREGRQLITAIEILSPVNKRKPGLEPYLDKRRELRAASVHLLEIDLLRRGISPVAHRDLDERAYLVALTRSNKRKTDIWAMSMKDILPVVPVPLMAPDEDVFIDLQQAFDEIFMEAGYQFAIDYSDILPPPELKTPDTEWLKSILIDRSVT